MKDFQIKVEERKVIQKSLSLFLLLLLLFGSLIVAMAVLFYQSQVNSVLSEIKTNQSHGVDLQTRGIADEFDNIISDLLFLTELNELQAFLNHGSPEALAGMGAEYVQLSLRKKWYDQIRFLDEKGMERIRVKYDDGHPVSVPKSQLYDKADQYYFFNTITLGAGEIFVSPMDLNTDNGRVEEPFKPVIRFGTPVFDSDGNKRGILLINYLASPLLASIHQAFKAKSTSPMLLNSDGYWLLGKNPADEWGFVLASRADSRFAKVYPEEWASVGKSDSGQLLTNNGLFTFEKIYPLRQGYVSSFGEGGVYKPSVAGLDPSKYFWVLLSHVPEDVVLSYRSNLQVKLLMFGAGLLFIFSLVAWVLALAITKRKMYQKQLVSMALYDALTELPNRKLFFDRLDRGICNAERYERRIGLLYIDLDGFKQVNDTLGHEAGDELLITVSKLLLASTRKSDTVARLGGEEFAVILTEINHMEDGELAGNKIIDALSRPVTLKSGTVSIGASIGVAVYPDLTTDSDKLVRYADQAMYQSKANGKNLCTPAEPEAE